MFPIAPLTAGPKIPVCGFQSGFFLIFFAGIPLEVKVWSEEMIDLDQVYADTLAELDEMYKGTPLYVVPARVLENDGIPF